MTTTTPTASAHRTYLKHSPYYAGLYNRFGSRMPRSNAERIAAAHGTTLEELAEAGLPLADHIKTLKLVETLGY